MKYQYTYTEYKDFPEATAISQSREAAWHPLSTICVFVVIASAVGLVIGGWEAIFPLIISIYGTYYMFRIYPKVTERKIKKAIKERIELMEEIKNSKYKCKYIKVLEPTKNGTCLVCFLKNKSLKLCKVKNNIGTREIYICESCMKQYQDNSES